MTDAIYIIIGVVAVAAIFLYFGRKKKIDMGTSTPAADPTPPSTGEPGSPTGTHGDPGVTDESSSKP